MSDRNIETIEQQLRDLGLTEEQIQRHVAPLITKEARPHPPRRKLGRPSMVSSHLFYVAANPVIPIRPLSPLNLLH